MQLRWYDQRLQGHRHRHRRRAAGAHLRDGRERLARRARVAAGAHAVHATTTCTAAAGRTRSFGDGALSTEPPGDEPADRFAYDPRRPGADARRARACSLEQHRPARPRGRSSGATTCSSTPTAPLERGPRGDRPGRAGAVRRLVSAPDTDFTATLVDVHPDGQAIHIVRGHRPGALPRVARAPTLIEPGEVYEYRDRPVGDEQRLPGRPPHPPRDLEQQLPALRPQPEHRRTIPAWTPRWRSPARRSTTTPRVPVAPAPAGDPEKATPHEARPSYFRIGADVGGTFTDVVAIDAAGRVWTHKVPSTPPDFEQAVLEARRASARATAGSAGAAVTEVAHGTTVATNAVLEHRGARTALITTRGFRDVLELRRIRAPQMYDLFFDKPRPLVERACASRSASAIAADGRGAGSRVDEAELRRSGRNGSSASGVESVAVCLLHAYAFPAARDSWSATSCAGACRDVPVSLSCEVLPRAQGVRAHAPRRSVNAYVRPVMQRYLARHARPACGEQDIAAPLLIMQSAGGLTPEEDAALRPVYVLESGPAAGVLAAGVTAPAAGAGERHHPRHGRHDRQGLADRGRRGRLQRGVRGRRVALGRQPAGRRRRRD